MSHIPRKRFGQNFLQDRQVIARIVDAIDPQPGERIVEIGPGKGAITFPLLTRAGKITAIEIDRDLSRAIRETSMEYGELDVIETDALAFNYTELAADAQIRVVGNLPYNISTPLLFHLLEHLDSIRDMHFMLQLEVVERMASLPGNKVYGRLSVMLQSRAAVEMLFTVPSGAFWPAPKVESAIVRITPLAIQPSKETLAALENIVRRAFSARRKTLANGLKGLLSAEQIAVGGIDPAARAETVSRDGFIRLAEILTAQPSQLLGAV